MVEREEREVKEVNEGEKKKKKRLNMKISTFTKAKQGFKKKKTSKLKNNNGIVRL